MDRVAIRNDRRIRRILRWWKYRPTALEPPRGLSDPYRGPDRSVRGDRTVGHDVAFFDAAGLPTDGAAFVRLFLEGAAAAELVDTVVAELDRLSRTEWRRSDNEAAAQRIIALVRARP